MNGPPVTLPPVLRLVPTAMTDSIAAALVADVQAEYVQRYGGTDVDGNDAAEFAGERGAFFVLWSEAGDGETEPVGTGAWRWHDVPAGLEADLAEAGVRMPAVDRVGDSWAARATLWPGAGLEVSASHAWLNSPEHVGGAGLDRRMWSAAAGVRLDGGAGHGRMGRYGVARPPIAHASGHGGH